MPYRIVLTVAIGLAAGLMSGLLGIGGGVVLVPAFVCLLHLPQREAHGTSLFVVFCTAIAGSQAYAKFGNVNWTTALVLAVGGIVGALIGAKLCAMCSNRRLKQIFGGFLGLVGIRMIADYAYTAFAAGPAAATSPIVDPATAGGIVTVLAIGVVGGIVSGLLGIGGGIILVPAMVFLLGFAQKLAQGISLAVIMPVSLFAGLLHYLRGNVRMKIGGWGGSGGVVGSLVGAGLANQMPQLTLRAVFGLLMIVVAVSMLRSASRLPAEPAEPALGD